MKFRINKIKIKLWSLFEEKNKTLEYYDFIDSSLEQKIHQFYDDDFTFSTPIEENEIKFSGIKGDKSTHFILRRIIPNRAERNGVILPEDLTMSKVLLYSDEVFSKNETVVLQLSLRKNITLLCEVKNISPASRILRKKNKFQKKYCLQLEIFKHFSSDYYLLKKDYFDLILKKENNISIEG